jgi:uncharacterized cupin superfamily protein
MSTMGNTLKAISVWKVLPGAWRWSLRASGEICFLAGGGNLTKRQAEAEAMFAARSIQYEA